MKVAFVHDWLTGMRGGERCLETFCQMFPSADIYTAIYLPENISEEINRHSISSSWLQKLPSVENYYRNLLPSFPLVAKDLGRQIARERYDLVISISHCFAKNVPVPPETFHLCYCLTPMRYLFDQYQAYFGRHPLELLIRQVVAPLRRWDINSSSGVTEFVAISEFVKARIQTWYSRQAEVVYPPVETGWIKPRGVGERGESFLLANALVPYKNSELVVRAFNRLELPLHVVGSGPEERQLRSLANENIKFSSGLSDEQLADVYRNSRALVFAAEEDFGMMPVEMMAAGRPVIGLGRGGLLETVTDGLSGILFSEPTEESLCMAVSNFLDREDDFTVDLCVKRARQFSTDRFRRGIEGVLSRSGFGQQQRVGAKC